MRTIAEFIHTNQKDLQKLNEQEFCQSAKIYENGARTLAFVNWLEEQGIQLVITSGFRCKELNERVGGVSNSRHCDGLAVDVIPKNMSIDAMILKLHELEVKRKYPIEDIIREKSWIHIEFKKND